MAKTVYFIGIVLLFSTLYSCSSKESLVQTPSFLASDNLPQKPSYEDNEEFADYYTEDYTSLTPANTTKVREEDVFTQNSNFNVNNYLTPTLTFSIGFSNFYGTRNSCNPFNRYRSYDPFYDPFSDPWGYYGFSNSSLYSNYLCGCPPSYWYGNTYYSQYYSGFYWGVPNTNQYVNPHANDNYPTPVINAPALPRSQYTAQSIDIPYTKTNKAKTQGKINYAKPKSTTTKTGSTRTRYTAKSSYSYTTKTRTNSKSGYYRPPSTPASYGSSTGGSGYSNNNGNTGYRPKTSSSSYPKSSRSSSSSSAGYTPPKSSGGGYKPTGGGSSGGGRMPTPTRNNSSSGSSTPRR